MEWRGLKAGGLRSDGEWPGQAGAAARMAGEQAGEQARNDPEHKERQLAQTGIKTRRTNH